jgi:hypothetical protein
MTYREKYPDVYKDLDRVRNGPKPVLFTPDDILTLKLLRDWHSERRLRYPDEKHRPLHTELTLETLERILKQVG